MVFLNVYVQALQWLRQTVLAGIASKWSYIQPLTAVVHGTKLFWHFKETTVQEWSSISHLWDKSSKGLTLYRFIPLYCDVASGFPSQVFVLQLIGENQEGVNLTRETVPVWHYWKLWWLSCVVRQLGTGSPAHLLTILQMANVPWHHGIIAFESGHEGTALHVNSF